MALYMLSTDIAVCLIRGTSRALDARVESTSHGELCISAVTRGELLCGLSLETLQTMAEEPVTSSMDQATLESLRKTTYAALAALTPREAEALRERFGLTSNATHTLEEVGHRFDVTRERIRYREQAEHLSRVVDQFLARVTCLPWDANAATHFATVTVELHRVRAPVGTTDAMIAGHAIAVGAVLVTDNQHRFASVRGLETENWTR